MSADHPLIRMLSAFEARVRELTEVLGDASHELSTERAVAAPWIEAHAHALRAEAARRIWFAAPVPLAEFLEPGNRMAILAPDVLRRLFAARALFACRDAVRRCVDRRVRSALAESVGPDALAALAAVPAARGAADHTLPEDVSPDALAREGWHALSAIGACGHPSLRNLIELSLAVASDDAQQAAEFAQASARGGEVRAPGPAAAASKTETTRFFSAAGGIFPELQWLFG
jgi:hypothetical protein